MIELEYMQRLMLVLGARRELRLWRQNVGTVPIRDRTGRVDRVFHAGPPKGASDLSGIVLGPGWRLEIETKGSKGKRSKEQIAWARFIVASGGVYVLAGYDDKRTLDENLATAVYAVEAAIRERRARCLPN